MILNMSHDVFFTLDRTQPEPLFAEEEDEEEEGDKDQPEWKKRKI